MGKTIKKVTSGISGTLFGSDAEQAGTAQSPGDAWLMQLLQPMLQQALSQGMAGNPLYNVPQAPQGPSIGTPYSPTQMPFSSPEDYLQRGEMDTARNVMENFYGGGAGGSARGGMSGAGIDREAALSSQLAQGAMGRYMQARQPYDLWANQAGRDVFSAQNQMNLAGYGGQMQQYGYENLAMAAPWNMMNMYPGSTGSPMVQPGQQGMLQGFGSALAGGAGTMGGMIGMDKLMGMVF